jgi:multiple sugar transport system substrate-binding protein
VSRRHLSALVPSALAACLALAGCTSDSDPTPAPSPSPSASSASPTPAEPVTLRLAVHGDTTLRDAWTKIARVYGNEHPEVTVEVEAAADAGTAMRKLREDAAAGDAPDLVAVPSEHAPALSADDLVQPVDQLLEERGVVFGDQYLRLGLEAFSSEQHLQCMPYDVSPLVVLYNRGLLPLNRLVEEDEEPLTPETGWTWEQFAKATRLMSGDGVKGVYVEPRLSTLMALVRSDGADVVDDPREATSLTFSDDGTRDALEEILDVLREPRLTPTPEQLQRQDGLSRFADEKVGMVLATRAVVPELRESGVDFDAFPLPRLARDRTVADISGLCLSATTEHRDAAADFLAFATGAEGERILAETGAVVPAHVPTLNSLAFTQPGEQPESVMVYVDGVARATVHPYVPGWPDAVDQVRSEIDKMFYAPVLDLETLLPRIDEKSQRVLAPETAEE